MTASSAIYPSLERKRVVVTGGASGIGAALVEGFVRQKAEVHFLDRLEDEGRALAARSGGAATFHACDLTDLDALAKTLAAVGDVDVLVNDAANDDRHTMTEVTPEAWEASLAVNLRHVYFATQAVVPAMRARGGGVVVNLGSASWHRGLDRLAVYQTAKAGIEGMTRALARELGRDGVRVVCVVPGSVGTPRQAKWYTPDDERAIVASQALKTRILPHHVAALVLFLASADAAACTGHEYWVDAGGVG